MTNILVPNGLIQLTQLQTWDWSQILDSDPSTLSQFVTILKLPADNPRYNILYTLALNKLLNQSLTWVKSHRSVIKFLDTLPLQTSQFGVTISGKLSDIFQMIDSWGKESPPDLFEKSFALIPEFFQLDYNDGITRDYSGLRAAVRREIEPHFSLTPPIIEKTVNVIDELYFSGLIKYRLIAANKNIQYRTSDKMTKCAGSLSSGDENTYILSLAAKIDQTISGGKGSGVVCQDKIDAFIVTVQHELIHLIVRLEMLRLGIDSNNDAGIYSSHGKLFKYLSNKFFGLTEATHDLYEKETCTNVNVDQPALGSTVTFVHKGQVQRGKVIKLNPKKAKVQLGPNNIFTVPYQLLRVVCE